MSKVDGEILWKKKLFFKQENTADLHGLIDQLKTDKTIAKQHPRFIVITDFKSLLAIDTKTADTLDISIADLAKHYDFFLPWVGMEKPSCKMKILRMLKPTRVCFFPCVYNKGLLVHNCIILES